MRPGGTGGAVVPEALVGAGVVGASGLAAAVWAGAQLAGLCFGAHRPVPVGMRDAVVAVPGLLTDPADPAAAWPAEAAALLPGAAGYWAAALVPLAVVAVLGGAALAAFGGGVGVARRRRMGLNPEARFARLWELAPLWVTGPTRGRLVLGRVRAGPFSRLVATEDAAAGLDACVPGLLRRQARRRRGDRGAVLVVGPSRCGKTTALAVPAILEWDGPLVAVSVKADLMGATLARRRVLGEVRVFDPTGVTGQASASWSPLAQAASLAGARQAARSIANSTDWAAGNAGDMTFWAAAAEDLLALLFWVAARAGLGMDTAVSWVANQDKDAVLPFARAFAAHDDPATRADGAGVLEAFTAVWRADAKQVSSVYLVARQMVRPWQEPAVQQSAAGPADIDLDWLLGTPPDSAAGTATEAWPDLEPAWADPDAEPTWADADPQATADPGLAGPGEAESGRANSLFLCADLDDAERLAPVLGGLLDDLLRDAYARVAATGRPLDPPLLVVVDEAGNWPMRNLPGRISTAAGMGIQLLLVYQSKAQIDAAYGAKADVVVSNAVTKVFFSGLSDKSSLDYAAGLLGQEHVAARTTSADTAPGGGRRGVSEAPTRLELLPSALLRQVAPGQALLVHHTLPPIHLHGRYWFRDPALSALATGTPPGGPARRTRRSWRRRADPAPAAARRRRRNRRNRRNRR